MALQKEFQLKLYPMDENEFIGTIWIENDVSLNAIFKSIQTVILLDRSGSMGDTARRLTNEIMPLVFSKLSYDKTQPVHLITFATNSQHHSVSVEKIKSLIVTAGSGTNMAGAVQKCHSIFESLDAKKPIRVLTISDGQVTDSKKTEEAATAFIKFINSSEFSINAQAVRLFTSKSQPDTRALCSLLQINNTTTSQLADIDSSESNESIATKISALFQCDNFSSGKNLTMERKIILKFPWDSATLSQIMLVPGQNVFWLKKVPSNELKISGIPVKVIMQETLTLVMFQHLMEAKLVYIVDHMKILKVVGTVEANKTVDNILKYFEGKEENLTQKLTLGKYFNADSSSRKKISNLLETIAKDENIEKLDSARIAEYLRGKGEVTSRDKSFLDHIANVEIDANLILIIIFVLLAIAVIKLFSE